MNANNLTNKSFWKDYWNNYQYKPVPDRMFFDRFLNPQLSQVKSGAFIEIGGFPGTMSIYFYKKFGFDVSLVDFYIDKNIVNKLEVTNNLSENTIHCIEADFFNFVTDRKYDFVFSLGFIEHFENTQDVIERHLRLLSDNGNLLIILPNFRGINGWIQKKFDRTNYDAHNLKSMEIDRLKEIMNAAEMQNVRITYTSKPMVWLEPGSKKSNRLARMIVKILSHFLKLFPIKSRLLSPYIVITGRKIAKDNSNA